MVVVVVVRWVVVVVVEVVGGGVCEGGCACSRVRLRGVLHSLPIATFHEGGLVFVAGTHASPDILPVKSFSSSSCPRPPCPP